MPSPRVALANATGQRYFKGLPPVSATFHTPSNAPAARLPMFIIPVKQVAVAIAITVFLRIVTPLKQWFVS
jgi:hypothetical protein